LVFLNSPSCPSVYATPPRHFNASWTTSRGLEFCFAYIDILIFSHTLEEHEHHLRTLFDRLQTYGILINPAKCVFKASEVIFLGYKVSAEGSRPLEEEWPTYRTALLPRQSASSIVF
jgi:hypothetical protein